MPTTPILGLPYPGPADAPDVPFDIQKLAEAQEAAAGRASLGEAGRSYRKILGALRNPGAGWAWLDDAGHRPTGFGPVSQSSSSLSIPYTFDGQRVSSVVVAPDETFAAEGLRCGASVGTDSLTVFMYNEPADRITDRVYYTGSGWASEHGVFTGFSFSGGILTLTHATMGDPADAQSGIALAGRGTAIEKAGNLTGTTTQVVFYTGSGGSLSALATPTTQACNVHVTRYGHRHPSDVPPLNPADVSSTTGNLWVIGDIEVAP